VHKDIKYSTSYWPQEPKLNKLKGTEEQDRLYKLDQDLEAICSQRLAESILWQEYNKFSDQEVENLRYAIEVEIKSYTEHELIIDIKTPLDMESITL